MNNLPILTLCAALTACGGGGSPIPAPSSPDAYTISAYGDSTQEAQGQPHAASRPGAKVYNRGVSGTNSAQLLAGTDGRNYPWPEMMRQESAAVVIINHGINDRARSVDAYKADLRALVSGAQAAGKVVMLELPNPLDVADLEPHRQGMREVAVSMGVYLCDQPRAALLDGIHPTPEGYKLKADRLAACVKDVM